MAKTFKRGDLVGWNSEAGRVRGVIVKKLVSNIRLYGYVHHASNAEPQYVINSVICRSVSRSAVRTCGARCVRPPCTMRCPTAFGAASGR
jgi:hypothetical protein